MSPPRSPRARHAPSSLAAFAVTLGLASGLSLGCATTPRATTDRRPDGVYHLKCMAKLAACLDEAERVCDHQPYAVLRAFDKHDRKGDTVLPDDFRTSEAFVRCGPNTSGTENKELQDQSLCPPPPAPPAPQGCTPGQSQACTGPAGCKGGQSCLPGGAAFGPCDCGPIAVPPPITP